MRESPMIAGPHKGEARLRQIGPVGLRPALLIEVRNSVCHRLRVFENMELRKIFGPRREEVTGDWKELRTATCIPRQVWEIR
jgi:hypothetical protein